MKDEKKFYCMAFHSTSHAIQTEKKAKELFAISMIPTPRELTNDCGLAIKFLEDDIKNIMPFYKSLTVPADLYAMSVERYEGKRMMEKLGITD